MKFILPLDAIYSSREDVKEIFLSEGGGERVFYSKKMK